MAVEALAVLRAPHLPALPAGLGAEACGGLWLVSGPAAPRGSGLLGLAARRRSLLRHAARRQAWLEALLPAGPLLPVRPGTLPDAAGLWPHARLLGAWLDRLQDRVQLQLTVRWDSAGAPAQFPDEAAEGTGRLAARLAQAMQAELGGVALDAIALPPAEEDMILNRVLLIAAGAEPALDAAVARIDALWPEGLRIRLVGPSPAVSFALLGLRPLPLPALAAAAAVLDLPVPATGAALAALAPAIAPARRRALIAGGDRAAIPDAAALLEAAAGMTLPPGALAASLMLPEVIRDGCARPVGPDSLPPPGPASAPLPVRSSA